MAYISEISLKNIRGFKDLHLVLGDKESQKTPTQTLFIGKNGTGKTTLLRSIVIGLCDAADGNALLAEDIGALIREGSEEALITITICKYGFSDKIIHKAFLKNVSGKSVVSGISRETLVGGEHLQIKEDTAEYLQSSDLFVCAYGAGRSGASSDNFRPYRIADSVSTLFDYSTPLIDTELTLRRLQDFRDSAFYKSILKKIKNVLGLKTKDSIKLPKGGGIIISTPSTGIDIPLNAWADGYLKTFTWIMDFYAWAMRADAIDENGDIHGILLIDELEQHLHPELQATLPLKLKKLFPKVQLLMTTHSPLLTLGAKAEEIISFKRNNNRIEAITDLPNSEWYSAEDILLDEDYFNTGVHKPDLNKKLEDYRKILKESPESRTDNQKKKLSKLVKDLKQLQKPVLEEDPILAELRDIRKKYNI
ncbi:MAG: AAA family ATPase [Calditrichia bacterium]